MFSSPGGGLPNEKDGNPIQDGKVKTNVVINTNWKTILFCRRGVLVRKEK